MRHTILTLACATLSLSTQVAQAGPLLDQFTADLRAYQAVQSTAPDRVIRYGDPQGALARAVLDPARVQPMVAEALEEVDGGDKLKAALESYKPISVKYAKAFEQLPGKYDDEYLDSFESMYRITLGGMKPLQSVKAQDIPDAAMRQMVEAAIKMAQALPAMLVSLLEKQVADGKFSASFEPMVKARIQAMRASAVTSGSNDRTP